MVDRIIDHPMRQSAHILPFVWIESFLSVVR